VRESRTAGRLRVFGGSSAWDHRAFPSSAALKGPQGQQRGVTVVVRHDLRAESSRAAPESLRLRGRGPRPAGPVRSSSRAKHRSIVARLCPQPAPGLGGGLQAAIPVTVCAATGRNPPPFAVEDAPGARARARRQPVRQARARTGPPSPGDCHLRDFAPEFGRARDVFVCIGVRLARIPAPRHRACPWPSPAGHPRARAARHSQRPHTSRQPRSRGPCCSAPPPSADHQGTAGPHVQVAQHLCRASRNHVRCESCPTPSSICPPVAQRTPAQFHQPPAPSDAGFLPAGYGASGFAFPRAVVPRTTQDRSPARSGARTGDRAWAPRDRKRTRGNSRRSEAAVIRPTWQFGLPSGHATDVVGRPRFRVGGRQAGASRQFNAQRRRATPGDSRARRKGRAEQQSQERNERHGSALYGGALLLRKTRRVARHPPRGLGLPRLATIAPSPGCQAHPPCVVSVTPPPQVGLSWFRGKGRTENHGVSLVQSDRLGTTENRDIVDSSNGIHDFRRPEATAFLPFPWRPERFAGGGRVEPACEWFPPGSLAISRASQVARPERGP